MEQLTEQIRLGRLGITRVILGEQIHLALPEEAMDQPIAQILLVLQGITKAIHGALTHSEQREVAMEQLAAPIPLARCIVIKKIIIRISRHSNVRQLILN